MSQSNTKPEIEPLSDYVLGRIITSEKSEGGIIKPATAQSGESRFEVVAVGPGKVSPFTGTTLPMPVKVGDRVVVIPGRPMMGCDDRGEYFLVAADHIAGIDRRPIEDRPMLVVAGPEILQ